MATPLRRGSPTPCDIAGCDLRLPAPSAQFVIPLLSATLTAPTYTATFAGAPGSLRDPYPGGSDGASPITYAIHDRSDPVSCTLRLGSINSARPTGIQREAEAIVSERTGRIRSPRGYALTSGVLTGTIALYITLVAFGNITDFDTNQQFVRHVLAMDTTFKDNDLMWRAIESTTLQDTAYIAIIVWESVAALVLLAATAMWCAGLRGGRVRRARQASTLGLVMLMVLFGAGFIAIGGEWFAMWQSKAWNGLEAATRVFMISGVVLLLIHLLSDERTDPGATN